MNKKRGQSSETALEVSTKSCEVFTPLMISTVVSLIYAYDRAKTLSFISLIRRKNTEFENESNV